VTTLTAPVATHDELNRDGIDRFNRSDLAGAAAQFRLAADLDPDFPPAWNNLGLVLQTAHRWSEAASAFDCALAARPDYPEALVNRARCLLELGRTTDALADCDRALACAGGEMRVAALHNRGTYRHRAGDLAGAEADLTLALELDPTRLDTRVNRAAVRKDAGDLTGARSDVDHALGELPSDRTGDALHLRGGVRALEADFRGAVADYDAALAAEPDNVCFLISRANAHYHLRDGRGVDDYRTAFRLNARAAAHEAARLLIDDVRRRPEEVLDNCDRHLRIDPDDALAHARRGLTLLTLGRDDEAAPAFARCRDLAPDQDGDLGLVVAIIRRALLAARK
jgi:tetratricopeptide (TPR) repeat protein